MRLVVLLTLVSLVLGAAACRFDRSGITGADDVVADDVIEDHDAAIPDANPDGFVPDADVADAPPDAMDLDLDDDTILDAVDNCVLVANLDQHDEDGDLDGDVCDNCPHLANADQANTTEEAFGIDDDTVGDACDPNPTGSDTISLFEPFAGAALPADWTSVGGGLWTVSGDELHQTVAVTGNHMLYLAGRTWTSPVLITGVDVDVVPAAGTTTSDIRAISTLVYYATGAQLGTGYLCTAYDVAGDNFDGALLIARFADDGALASTSQTTLSGPLSAGLHVRMTELGTGGTIGCQSSTSVDRSRTLIDSTHTTGTIALRTNAVAASYRYVVVITPVN